MITIAMQRIDIGDASAIYFLMVVWVPLMESVWHRRCIEARIGFGALLSALGVLFLSRPTFIFGELKDDSQEKVRQRRWVRRRRRMRKRGRRRKKEE